MISYRISRVNPKSGLVEQPYRDKDGQFVLADPVGGAQRHHAKFSVRVGTTADAVAYLEKGFPIRMTDGKSAPALVSAKSLTITPVEVDGEDESSLGAGASRHTLPTKDAVMEELKKLMCVQAGHIALAGSTEAAAAFIGFESESVGYPYEIGAGEWKKVDLSRFAIEWRILAAYDYAFQCGEYWHFDAGHAQDIRAFVGGIPPYDITGSGYEFMGQDGLCRRIADTAYARWKLIDGHDLTVRELSLLANITESATRTALSREGISAPDGTLSNDQALDWLRGRRGFIPTKSADTSVKDQTFFWSEFAFRQFGLAAALTRLITEWLKTTPKDIGKKAEVSQDFMDALMAGYPLLDLDALQRVGAELGVDVPQFVGLAVQEALRAEKATVLGGRAA
jgi:hypothetical protein